MAASSQLNEVSKSWHEDLATYMIQNPGATQAQIAKHFDRSVSWISIVKNSDAFQDYYKARRGEVDALADATLVDKLESVAELGIEALMEKLQDHFSGEAPLGLDALKEVSDMALNRLGFGARKAHDAPLAGDNATVIIADTHALEAARRRLAEIRDAAAAEIEREPIDITPEEDEGQTREDAETARAVSPPE